MVDGTHSSDTQASKKLEFKELPSRREVVDAAASLLHIHGPDLFPTAAKEFAVYKVEVGMPKLPFPKPELSEPFTNVLVIPAPTTEATRKCIILVQYKVALQHLPRPLQEIVKQVEPDPTKFSLAFLGSMYPEQTVPVPCVFVIPDLDTLRLKPIAVVSWGHAPISPTTTKAVANALLSQLSVVTDDGGLKLILPNR